MATRPVFAAEKEVLVRRVDVKFQWHPGFALSQKRKSIDSLHEAAMQHGLGRPLEVSTKSPLALGRSLSSFNLRLPVRGNGRAPLECVFQGSKVFEKAGPFTDLFSQEPASARRDPRLRGSGRLTHFEWDEDTWQLLPRTAFYDWLYLNALLLVPADARELEEWDAFTDIEFNPRKSLNTQARSCALYVALRRAGTDVRGLLADKERFLSVCQRGESENNNAHGRLSLNL